MKLTHRVKENIQSVNKSWSSIYSMFSKPMIHLKKLAKYDTKELDKKLIEELNKKVDLIDKTIDEIDQLLEKEMFKR